MKNLFLLSILSAAAMVSCSQDETTTAGDASSAENSDIVGINIYAGTTRGVDTTTETLEDETYVELYIDDSYDINDYYTFSYSDTDKDWSQNETEDLTWGEITFPANFFSVHDGDPFTGLTFGSNDKGDYAQYTDYTVTGASSSHADLVYHASTLNAIPSDGMVNAKHSHALSKINLFAATGTYKIYIAKAQLVDVTGKGTVTIRPIAADDTATTGATWALADNSLETYEYFSLGSNAVAALSTGTTGKNPIINTSEDAPMMIIPQTTTAATVDKNPAPDGTEAIIEDTYVEVIYYLTDANDKPVVGYSAVSERADANTYIPEDQTKALYVMAAFPLGNTFDINKIYDIALGVGAKGSTGGKLVKDYYVDKNGDAVTLTKLGDDSDGDGDCDEDDGKETDVPEIEESDDILKGGNDSIDITVSTGEWGDKSDIKLEH